MKLSTSYYIHVLSNLQNIEQSGVEPVAGLVGLHVMCYHHVSGEVIMVYLTPQTKVLTSLVSMSLIRNLDIYHKNTLVISKVLHIVRFLFKNEFILQNTFTGLQCILHCALSQPSSVWASFVFLSGRLRC
jgi:hypothetical protein